MKEVPVVRPPACKDIRLNGAGSADGAGASRGRGDDDSSTDVSAVAVVPDTRGCGEVDGCEQKKHVLEQTAGEMPDDEIPGIT